MQALAPTAETFTVERVTWAPGVPDGPAVTLYRIVGGGHGWPSARQYLAARLIGRIPQGFDATGIVLTAASAAVERG